MYTQNVTINNEVGLHARPATFFIQKANEFKSGIWLEKDERRVNAKSLLGVLTSNVVMLATVLSSVSFFHFTGTIRPDILLYIIM